MLRRQTSSSTKSNSPKERWGERQAQMSNVKILPTRELLRLARLAEEKLEEKFRSRRRATDLIVEVEKPRNRIFIVDSPRYRSLGAKVSRLSRKLFGRQTKQYPGITLHIRFHLIDRPEEIQRRLVAKGKDFAEVHLEHAVNNLGYARIVYEEEVHEERKKGHDEVAPASSKTTNLKHGGDGNSQEVKHESAAPRAENTGQPDSPGSPSAKEGDVTPGNKSGGGGGTNSPDCPSTVFEKDEKQSARADASSPPQEQLVSHDKNSASGEEASPGQLTTSQARRRRRKRRKKEKTSHEKNQDTRGAKPGSCAQKGTGHGGRADVVAKLSGQDNRLAKAIVRL